MPRKKSVKGSASAYVAGATEIETFLTSASKGQSDEHVTWLYNYAIIRLYRCFESMMLDALVGAINNDTKTIAATTGIEFPKHLTDEVCLFLVTGTGYFDFKGRSGLIKTLKWFVPDTHYLVTIIKKSQYTDPLDRLCALRNFAAHESAQSKRTALESIGGEKISSSGAWLKKRGRFQSLSTSLKALANDIKAAAPF